jgi:hypothetical protein
MIGPRDWRRYPPRFIPLFRCPSHRARESSTPEFIRPVADAQRLSRKMSESVEVAEFRAKVTAGDGDAQVSLGIAPVNGVVLRKEDIDLTRAET